MSRPIISSPILLTLLSLAVQAQTMPKAQLSGTTEDLRGIHVVSPLVAWASGTHGTYLRTTDGGSHWTASSVTGAENLDFRAVIASSADEAFLMSAGPGEQSRLYHTYDAGQHWSLQFTNKNPKGFFDCMAFWDRMHGIVLGDPIPDKTGKLKFELLVTDDGENWREIDSAALPPAIEGEGAFAASNSCLAILPSTNPYARAPAHHDPFKSPETSVPRIRTVAAADSNIWFATGGKAARVFHSPDRGRTWTVMPTPIMHGPDSAGIFSMVFHDSRHGVIGGGDYKRPDEDGPNLAFTSDGGKSWTLSTIHPQAYFSAVAYDASSEYKDAIFAVNPNFIFDMRSLATPVRISPGNKGQLHFNAVSPEVAGGALFVGPKGTIISVVGRR